MILKNLFIIKYDDINEKIFLKRKTIHYISKDHFLEKNDLNNSKLINWINFEDLIRICRPFKFRLKTFDFENKKMNKEI